MGSVLFLVAVVVNPSLSVWPLVRGLCFFIAILCLLRHSCLDFYAALSLACFSSYLTAVCSVSLPDFYSLGMVYFC